MSGKTKQLNGGEKIMKPFIAGILGLFVQFFLAEVILASEAKNELEEQQTQKAVIERQKTNPLEYVPNVQDIPHIQSLGLILEKTLGHFSKVSSQKFLSPDKASRAMTFERGELDVINGARRNPIEWLESTIRDVQIQIQKLKSRIQSIEMEYNVKNSIWEDYQAFVRKGEKTVSSVKPAQENMSTGSYYSMINPVNLMRKAATRFIWPSSTGPIDIFDQLYVEELYKIYEFLYRPALLDEELRTSRSYHQVRELYSRGDYSLLLDWRPDLLNPQRSQLIYGRERIPDELFWEIKRSIMVDLKREIKFKLPPQVPERSILEVEESLLNDKNELYKLLTKKKTIKKKLSRIQNASNIDLNENHFTFEEKLGQELKSIEEQIKDLESRVRTKEDKLKNLCLPQIQNLTQKLLDLLRGHLTQKPTVNGRRDNRSYFMLLREYETLYEKTKGIDTKLEEAGFKLTPYSQIFNDKIIIATEETPKSSEILLESQSNKQDKYNERMISSAEDVREKKSPQKVENSSLQSSASSGVDFPLTPKPKEENLQEQSFCMLCNKIGNKTVVRSGKKVNADIATLVLEEAPKIIADAYACFEEEIIMLGLPEEVILRLKEPLQLSLLPMIENIMPYRFDKKEGHIILRPIVTLDLAEIAQNVENLSLANLEKLQKLLKEFHDNLKESEQKKEATSKRLITINKKLFDLNQEEQKQIEQQGHPLSVKTNKVLTIEELGAEAKGKKARHEALVKQLKLKKNLEIQRDRLEKEERSLSIEIAHKKDDVVSLTTLIEFEQAIKEWQKLKDTADITIPITDEERGDLEVRRQSIRKELEDKTKQQAEFKIKFLSQKMLEPMEEALKKMSRLPKQRLKIRLPKVAYQNYIDKNLKTPMSMIIEAYKKIFQTNEGPSFTFKTFDDVHEIWVEIDIPEFFSAKRDEAQQQQADPSLQNSEATGDKKINDEVMENFIVLDNHVTGSHPSENSFHMHHTEGKASAIEGTS